MGENLLIGKIGDLNHHRAAQGLEFIGQAGPRDFRDGEEVGVATPIARAVLAKIKAAEDAGAGSPGITAGELLG